MSAPHKTFPTIEVLLGQGSAFVAVFDGCVEVSFSDYENGALFMRNDVDGLIVALKLAQAHVDGMEGRNPKWGPTS